MWIPTTIRFNWWTVLSWSISTGQPALHVSRKPYLGYGETLCYIDCILCVPVFVRSWKWDMLWSLWVVSKWNLFGHLWKALSIYNLGKCSCSTLLYNSYIDFDGWLVLIVSWIRGQRPMVYINNCHSSIVGETKWPHHFSKLWGVLLFLSSKDEEVVMNLFHVFTERL